MWVVAAAEDRRASGRRVTAVVTHDCTIVYPTKQISAAFMSATDRPGETFPMLAILAKNPIIAHLVPASRASHAMKPEQ